MARAVQCSLRSSCRAGMPRLHQQHGTQVKSDRYIILVWLQYRLLLLPLHDRIGEHSAYTPRLHNAVGAIEIASAPRVPFDIFSRFSTLSKASCLCIVSDGASWGPMGTDSRDSKALPGACDECPSYPHEALCEALSAFQVLTCLSLGLRDTYTEETCDNKPHHRCANAKLRCTQAPSPSLDQLTGRRKSSHLLASKSKVS